MAKSLGRRDAKRNQIHGDYLGLVSERGNQKEPPKPFESGMDRLNLDFWI